MSEAGYAQLQDVLLDEDFPDLDLALRRGRHVDREDASWYTLCLEAQAHLEAFYRRYGCELIHKSDGYFYLLPSGDKLSRRQLTPGDMLVGQALALLYLDPAAIERHGVVGPEEVIAQLSAVLGSDALIAAFNPKRKRHDERVAHKNVRAKVAEAVRRLASLGFVEVSADDRLRLRPALLRFAEPVRGLSEPAEALAKLAARGEVTLEPEVGEDELAADGGGDADVEELAADGGGDELAANGGAGPLVPAADDESEGSDDADWDPRAAALFGLRGDALDLSASEAADEDPRAAELFGLRGDALDPSASEDLDEDPRAAELFGLRGDALDPSASEAADEDTRAAELFGLRGDELDPSASEDLDEDPRAAELFAATRRLEVPSDLDDDDSEAEVSG